MKKQDATTLLNSLILGITVLLTNAHAQSNDAVPPDGTKKVAKPTKPTEPPPSPYYGIGLCNNAHYECVKVQSGETWEKLFPDEGQRDLVQRVNRCYNNLWAGKIIAVPRHLSHVTMLSLSPFPQKINGEHEKEIIVDQDKLAWGAYDAEGQLVKWGPIASGRDKCPDSNNICRTLTGLFRVFSKESKECVSDVFPIGKGGAKMPYCMFFHKGFALHGSPDMPGYRASHGCVRMFVNDAKWLNEEFVQISNEANHYMGTLVIIRPVTRDGKEYGPPKLAVDTPVSKKALKPTLTQNQWINPDEVSTQ